jgi:hypothetical protein
MAHLGQHLTLSIGQQYPPRLDLVAQDTVFRCQIGIAQPEFLIDGARDRG